MNKDVPGMSLIVFCQTFEDNLQDFPKWHFLFMQQLDHKDRTLFWLQIQQLYQVMLWHCYHRQVAKEHPQSKYLSKLTSSLYSLQSGRRKGIQPLRNVKMKEKKRLLVFVKENGVSVLGWSRCRIWGPDRCPGLRLRGSLFPGQIFFDDLN